MAGRESRVIVGCRECEQKNKELRYKHGVLPFPATIAYTKDELGELVYGFTCSFCKEKLHFTKNMVQMMNRLLGGPAHIVSHPDSTEILSTDTHVYIPHDRLFESLQEFWAKQGSQVEGLDPLVFQNPKEDLALIHDAMNDFDTNKWFIMIESAGNPEPFLWDDQLWFNLFGGDDGPVDYQR